MNDTRAVYPVHHVPAPEPCVKHILPERKAGESGVAASTAAINAEASLVCLALLDEVFGCVTAVIHIHDSPLAP